MNNDCTSKLAEKGVIEGFIVSIDFWKSKLFFTSHLWCSSPRKVVETSESKGRSPVIG